MHKLESNIEIFMFHIIQRKNDIMDILHFIVYVDCVQQFIYYAELKFRLAQFVLDSSVDGLELL